MPGFGELFRYLSFIRGVKHAWLSRAIAGLYDNILVFAIPGSKDAVSLALNELIVPSVRHAIEIIDGYSHWIEKERE